ncbi:MAG: hypothetical protein LLF94_04815 [Chlamydiales bacterium]|nr:hypothetical protein [Chlamydiales bacterium]
MSRIDPTNPSSFEPSEARGPTGSSRTLSFIETLSTTTRESPDFARKAASFSFNGIQNENVVVAFAKMTVQTIGDCGVHI